MKYISVGKIKPDSNQPRRTFNEEKMKALEASMKDHGFRKQYPLVIDESNILIDGERRWRAARRLEIKEVPVEVKRGMTSEEKKYERTIYQLQSEGEELLIEDKYKKWAYLYKNAKKYKKDLQEVADKIGEDLKHFEKEAREYLGFIGVVEKLPHSVRQRRKPSFKEDFRALKVVAREKDSELKGKMAEKSVLEKWTGEKAQAVRNALKEKPLRRKQILSQDYSDPYEGSTLWKSRLEVAKSDVDIEKIKQLDDVRGQMEEQVDAFDRIIEYSLKLDAAINTFDYEAVTPRTRVELHKAIAGSIPNTTEWFDGLTKYMIKKGELTSGVKELKK